MQPRYVAIRLAQTVFLLWIVMTLLFFLFKTMPGNMSDTLATSGASQAYLNAFEERWGLNDPLHVQYWQFLTNYATLDFGTSMRYNQPVLGYVGSAIFNSFILVAPSLTFVYLFGTFLGTILGVKRGSWVEKLGMIPVVGTGSTPSFFIGILLVIVFALKLNWLPTTGMISAETATQFNNAPWWRIYFTGDFLLHYILPFLTITLRYLYVPLLLMRTSVIEVSGQDFSYYHRMTGLPTWNRMKHLAKHASLPVVTNFPLSFAKAFGGLVIIEVVFNWPGIGFILLQSVLTRDLPVVRFVFLIVAIVIIFGNFIVDMVYGIIDPRVSVE